MDFEVLNFIPDNFINPQKRIFLGYLLSGFFIAFLWLYCFRKYTLINSLKLIFDKKVYFSKSSFVDYSLYVFNSLIMIIFSPILLSQLVIATFIFEFMYAQNIIEPISINYLSIFLPIIFTICFFIVDDFSKFLVHMLMHKIKFLWCFHKIHHSAEVLTPMTVFRTHPIEGVIFVLRNAISQGAVIGIFFFISSGELSLVTVLGANLFSFMFHLLGSNLRHSHISISYGKLVEKILISPAQHQIHHSVEKKHHDKNFGVTFAIWDYFFNTLVYSQSNQKIKYGLSDEENYSRNNIFKIYLLPIIECLTLILDSIFKSFKCIYGYLLNLKPHKLNKNNKVLQNENS